MINLLPEAEKKQIRAGRSNVLLVRYTLLMILIVALLFVSIGVTYYILKTSEQSASSIIATNAAKESEYSDIRQEAEKFREQLSNAKAVFDNNTSYSQAMLVIAELIPQGAVLSDLRLNETSFTQPIVLHANVKNERAALDLKESFQNSPNFSDATFGQIKKIENSTYPYSIELSVTMKKEAATK